MDGQWLSDTIAASRALRMFVPRVYGLGDLSHILDDRAYTQASFLIESAKDQISTFVVTGAYRKAVQALRDRGFVLLLGEPAVGKSSIALMLAISAADSWGCVNVKARDSEELVQRWNPHEKGQFFWVDDAFGAVRHERHLTDGWARDLPHVMSAVKNGARVVLTARSYIYNEARPFLKTYAYPLLHEQEVTVDVAEITKGERQQILYNHLSVGDQSHQVISEMKPHLEAAAGVEPFRPEAARRLGLRMFTRNLDVTQSGIEAFMSHPHDFLSDVYSQLDNDAQAALALVYVKPWGLASPLRLESNQRDIIERAGGTAGATGKALTSLVGTFLQRTIRDRKGESWSFRHPTLREGFSTWLIGQPYLLSAILAGMDDEALLDHTHCLASGDELGDGVLLKIPEPFYKDVAARLASLFEEWPEGSCWTADATRYLGEKCSDEMLLTFLSVYPSLPCRITDFFSSVSEAPEPLLLARLHRKGALPEKYRWRTIEQMGKLAVDGLDAGWLTDSPWQQILTSRDREQLLKKVQNSLIPHLNEIIDEDPTRSWGWSARGSDPLFDSLHAYFKAFESQGDIEAARKIKSAMEERFGGRLLSVPDGQGVLFRDFELGLFDNDSSRSVFSDLDDGM
ncbi:hypothetical protein P1P68_13855 [Streptomyces scabiei]|uniref:nSTAND3 domain-containing NTPase n=1 Tax=Streptomyces scabiei TaxID=1930 RepID=UPI00298F5EFD|nr:hypothetical protein [Streptomyces scabiei]MDW8805838.1 hypothetical protein [Streptomyces scabiei]